MECFGIAAEMDETRHRTALPRKGQRSVCIKYHLRRRVREIGRQYRRLSSSTMDILHSLNRGLRMSII